MEYGLAVVLLLALVAVAVARPLWAPASPEDAQAERREELEAAKEAKYREIREAELDRETGKLSDGDWRRIDRELRAEAVEILKKLDELG